MIIRQKTNKTCFRTIKATICAAVMAALLLMTAGCGDRTGAEAAANSEGEIITNSEAGAAANSEANIAAGSGPETVPDSAAGTSDMQADGQDQQDESTEPDSIAEPEPADAYELQTRELFAMDTYMTFSAYGADAEAALEDAEEEIFRLDQLLAAESEDSEVARLNRNGGGALSDDTVYLIGRALALHEETDGAFEIAVYPIKQAWGFTDEAYRVPDDAELQRLLPLADSDQIRLDAEEKQLSFAKEGMEIDLGGIAKGYASSRLAEIFAQHNVKGMINLGGNVQVYGSKPDGSDWRVAVRAPERDADGLLPWLSQAASGSSVLAGIDYIGVLETHDQAVVTSGGYERYFEQDGQIYHHIIDPKTGYPSDADLISATVVSRDGTLADGLSTSVFVLGLDDATALWRAHRDEFDMILMDAQGDLYATDGIREQFASDLDIHWIQG